jgi:hypothetical protein
MASSLFGLKEWAVRLPALIFGLASIFITWRIGRKLFSTRIVLLTSALLAVSPAHIAWSVTARGYSGYLLCTTLLILLYLQTLRTSKSADKYRFILLTLTGYFFHSLSLLFVVVLVLHPCLTALIAQRNSTPLPEGIKNAWENSGLALSVTALLCFPFIARTWVEHRAYPRAEFFPDFPFTLWNALTSYPWPALSFLGFFLFCLGLTTLQKKNPHTASLFTLLLLLPLAMWVSRPSFLYERFWAGLVPVIFLLTTQGVCFIEQQGQRWKQTVKALILVLITGLIFAWADGKAPMIKDTSWSLRDDIQTAEGRVPPGTPLYALEGQDRFFRDCLKQPVMTLQNVKAYTKAIALNRNAIFLILPDYIKSASHEARPIFDILINGRKEEKTGIVSMFKQQL